MRLRSLLLAIIYGGTALAAEPLAGPLRVAFEAAEKGDFPAAAKLLRIEADRGNADAQNALGDFALAGRTGPRSPAEAAGWYQKAADASHPQAMFSLASLLATGAKGVNKDSDKARFLLRAAAEAGHAPAQTALGTAAEREGNPAEARTWFEKAAAQHDPDALLALARLTDRDDTAVKATELYLRAAQAGSVVAMNEVGVRYQKGTGLRQDAVAAIGWFSLAAQHHLPVAHTNLGNCYEIGAGALQDYDRAGANYAAAAKLNFGPAQFLLAQLFESGRGTAVDLAKAYVLYARAARRNVPEADEYRDATKAKLSSAQLAAAEKLLADEEEAAPPLKSSKSSSPRK